jgi:hypothetical protein
MQGDEGDFWRAVSGRIEDDCSARIESLCPTAFQVCLDRYWRKKVRLDELVKWYGVRHLFRDSAYIGFMSSWRPSAALALLDPWLADTHTFERGPVGSVEDLELAGQLLLECPTPWAEARHMHVSLSNWSFERPATPKGTYQDTLQSPRALFGAFALMATLLEDERHGPRAEILERIKRGHGPLLHALRSVFLARYDPSLASEAQTQLDRCEFSDAQEDLIWRWARGKTNLLAHEQSRRSPTALEDSDEEAQ